MNFFPKVIVTVSVEAFFFLDSSFFTPHIVSQAAIFLALLPSDV